MFSRNVQVVDHVVENSNKSTSNQRLIPYKVLIGKGITLNTRDSTVHEDHASMINSHKFKLQQFNFSFIKSRNALNPCTKFNPMPCGVFLSSSYVGGGGFLAPHKKPTSPLTFSTKFGMYIGLRINAKFQF